RASGSHRAAKAVMEKEGSRRTGMRTSCPRFAILNDGSTSPWVESLLRMLAACSCGTARTRIASMNGVAGFTPFRGCSPRYLYEGLPSSARYMRALALALSLLLLAALLAPLSAGEAFGAVGKVTKLISVQEAPLLAPGESGRFVFYFNSTYTEPIRNVRLNASIYQYATI